MNDIQTLLATAQTAHTAGAIEDALTYYSDAFNLYVAEAATFARTQTHSEDYTDTELHDIAPLLLEYSRTFLMRDLTAATILNAMGVLFAEQGDFDNAKQKFEESIDYTPASISYDEPRAHLEDISSRVIRTVDLEPTDE